MLIGSLEWFPKTIRKLQKLGPGSGQSQQKDYYEGWASAVFISHTPAGVRRKI
jgi:hypothetical protein